MKRPVVLCSLLVLLGTHGHAVATHPTNLAQSEFVPRILRIIRNDYVSPDLVIPRDMLISALDTIQRAVPEILATDFDSSVVLTVGQATRKFPLESLADLGALWNRLRELLTFIDLNYHGTTKANDIEYAAVEGMLDSLDPHSNLLRPKDYAEFKVGTKGNFGGIGIVIGSRDGQLTVISPIDGTPAARAGLKAQDRIIQINEDSTVNMTLNEAVERLRGRVGTPVTLTIERTGRSAFAATLKRAIIEIDSVQSTLLAEGDKQIGYIKIKSFQENTFHDLYTQLAALHEKAAAAKIQVNREKKIPLPKFLSGARPSLDGLVLDMRNNPGGLLEQAIQITDLFLSNGVIVSTVGSRGKFVEESSAHGPGTEPAYPIMALINEGSASASEIVTGSLQANHRALVIGNRSFGKGSVQTVYDQPDGSALKMTIAEYLTAGKNSIQEIGITPDIQLLPVTVDPKRMNLQADIAFGEKDLEKHLKRHAMTQTAPPHHLHYMAPVADDDPEAQDTKAYSNALNLTDDFPAQFAAQIAAEAGHFGGAWHDIAPLLATTQATEDGKLAAQLTTLGIDWRTGPAAGKPQLALRFHIEKEGKRVAAIEAGQEADLVFSAKNTGTGPFHQLRGQTKSETHLFANKELVIGYLPAGSTAERRVPFKAERYMTTETIPVTWQFEELNHQIPPAITALIPVAGLTRPQFAFAYELGPIAGKSKTGGPLPLGKSLPLTVHVKNVGPGASQETVVTIRNDGSKGPYIEAGRAKLGALNPGQSADANLKFHLDPGFNESTFTLELSVIDPQLLETGGTTLTVTLGSGTVEPPAGPWYRAPNITVAANMPGSTGDAQELVKAALADDQQIKDYFVFVGDKKVFYQANPQPTATAPLEATLPLKPGSNLVTIAARDQDNLTSRYTFSLYRTSEGPTPIRPE